MAIYMTVFTVIYFFMQGNFAMFAEPRDLKEVSSFKSETARVEEENMTEQF